MRNIILTGVGNGMSCSIAKLLSESGNNLFLVGRSETVKIIGERFDIPYAMCDLNNYGELKNRLNEILKTFNITDIVHCAGNYFSTEDIFNTDIDFFETALMNNARTFFNVVKLISPYMKNNGGSITVIGAAKNVYYNSNPGYAAGKGAVIYMMKSLASQLAKYNIRVNSISPGFTAKDDCFKMPENIKLLSNRRNPSYYIALAVNQMVENNIITGQNIDVDGGNSTQI